MNYLDRYLERYFGSTLQEEDGKARIPKKHFQLVTMTCLYIALKLKCQSKVPLDYMVQLSRGTVTIEELRAMECELLGQLGWLLHPPTSFDFLKHYLKLLRPVNSCNSNSAETQRWTALEDMASFLIELSVLDYYFVTHRPSTVAIAALLNAMDNDPWLQLVRNKNASDQNSAVTHTCYYGYDALILPGERDHVHQCRQRLASLYQNTSVTTTDSEEPSSPRPQDIHAGPHLKEARIASPVSVATDASNMHSVVHHDTHMSNSSNISASDDHYYHYHDQEEYY
jgi:hypothetical protein